MRHRSSLGAFETSRDVRSSVAIVSPAITAVTRELCCALNQYLQQFIGVLLRRPYKSRFKFHDVDAPFAAFVFGDKRLRPTKAFGEFMLG
jgi:hypothetical protein